MLDAILLEDEENEYRYSSRNYCEYGHYEEFDLDDPTWPKCKNDLFHELNASKGLDCE